LFAIATIFIKNNKLGR